MFFFVIKYMLNTPGQAVTLRTVNKGNIWNNTEEQ